MTRDILADLNRAKVLFQLCAIEAVMGFPASVDRNPEGEKPQALSAQHESAVPLAADAPAIARKDPS